MSSLSRFAFVAPFAALAFATPASAQEEGGDRVNMVIAYSEDECPEPMDENEIFEYREYCIMYASSYITCD